MMRFIKYLPILFLCLFYSSCEEEHESMGNKPVSFYLISDPETRSNEKEDFVDGDAIGVYVLDRSVESTLKPIGNFADNKKYVWSSEKKAFVAESNNELIYNSSDRPLTFYVYFPYYSQVTDATSLRHTIAGANRSDDFLFAVNSSSGGVQNVPVSFKHLLSKVNVKYTSTENRDKTSMSVYTYTDMNINLSIGGITTVANIRKDIALERVDASDHAGFVGVIAPQTWLQGEKFGTLAYTGGGSHPFSFAQDRTFASGEENEVFFMSREPAYVFSVTPTTLSVPAKASSAYPFTITSTKSDAVNGANLPGTTVNHGYGVMSHPDWVTVSGTNITISENRGSERTGVVTFKQDDSEYTTSITLIQAAGVTTYDYTFMFSDATTSKSWSGVPAIGGSNTYSITSTRKVLVNDIEESTEPVTYTGSSDVPWITVSGDNITVSENRSAVRSGVVTFTQIGSGQIITVNVTQIAGVTTYDYTFTFDNGTTSQSWSGVAASGGTNTYSIISTRKVLVNDVEESTEAVTYSGSSNVTWITVSGTSLIVSENRDAARSGLVTFTQTGSGKTITVTVSQAAGVITYDYSFTFDDGSTSKSWTGIAATGGTNTYSIISTRKVLVNGTLDRTEQVTYSGSANATWITFSGSSIIVDDNPNLTPRGGLATFTQTGSGKTVTVTILQQKKNSVEID